MGGLWYIYYQNEKHSHKVKIYTIDAKFTNLRRCLVRSPQVVFVLCDALLSHESHCARLFINWPEGNSPNGRRCHFFAAWLQRHALRADCPARALHHCSGFCALTALGNESPQLRSKINILILKLSILNAILISDPNWVKYWSAHH